MFVREYTVREEIYSFNELSESAKENARRKFLEYFRQEDEFEFSDCVRCDLSELFPSSDVEVEFSLNYCQGDGLNVFGSFHISDIVNYVLLSEKAEKLTKQEKRFLRFLSTLDFFVKCKSNNRYSYYTHKVADIQWYIENELEGNYFRSIPYETIERVARIFDDRLEDFCSLQEEEGYKYFYEVKDDDIVGTWEVNEYLGFDKNGNPIYS